MNRRSRFVLFGAVLVGVALAGFVGARWMWFRKEPAPLPQVRMEELHPLVAAAIQKAMDDVRADPRSGAAWGQLGAAFMIHGMRPDAIYAFRQAAELDGEEPRWHYLLGFELAFESPENALSPLHRAVELVDAKDPSNSAPRLRYAELLLQLDRVKEAEDEYSRVRRSDPGNARALFGSGLAAMARAEFADAESYLREASKSPLCRRKACARLASLAQRRGSAEAAELTRQASSPPSDLPWNDPYVDPLYGLDQARETLFHMARKRSLSGEGAVPFEELVQVFPSGRAYLALATARREAGDRIGAEEALRQALDLPDFRVPAEYALSTLLYDDAERLSKQPTDRDRMVKRATEAMEHLKRALEQKPDHALSHFKLGEVQILLGQRADAIRSFRAGLECRPELSEGHLLLGEALAADGQRELAGRELEEAVRLATPAEEKRARQALQRFNPHP